VKNNIEIDIRYFHNPISRDELLPLHHDDKRDGVDGVKGETVGDFGSVSPPILAVCKSVSCFPAASS
jgi:hypothetical protein